VPIPVASVVASLPRIFRNVERIQTHLKRKLIYRDSFMVSPSRVVDAIRYIVQTEHRIFRDVGLFRHTLNVS